MAAIKRMQGPNRYAVLMPINEFEQQLSLALQQPDPLLRDDDTRGNFSSPGFRRTLAFYANMFEQGWAPKMSETQISNVWDEFFRGFNVFYIPAHGTSASSRSCSRRNWKGSGAPQRCRGRKVRARASPVAPAW